MSERTMTEEKVLDCLAAEVRTHSEWDEPPGLLFLYLDDGMPRLRRMEIPDEIWAADRPPQVLERIAAIWDRLPVLQAMAPDGLYGAAFFCEAWVVKAQADGPERAQMEADAREHLLHARPDRKEMRGIFAVDRTGTVYQASQERGTEEVDVICGPFGEGGEGTFAGTVPEALRTIVRALCARRN